MSAPGCCCLLSSFSYCALLSCNYYRIPFFPGLEEVRRISTPGKITFIYLFFAIGTSQMPHALMITLFSAVSRKSLDWRRFYFCFVPPYCVLLAFHRKSCLFGDHGCGELRLAEEKATIRKVSHESVRIREKLSCPNLRFLFFSFK